MNVLILDTETTSLSPADGQCIEVAVVRYSVTHRAVTEAHSWLLKADSNAAESINHIPSALLQNADDPAEIWDAVGFLAASTDAVCAHNADFDRQWVPPDTIDVPWIDTCHAVDWPLQSRPGVNLIHLCLEHGVGVVDAHRALSDCLMLARLMTRCAELGHDVEALLARGLRPRAWFEALVPISRKDEAKDLGFGWMNPGHEKHWTRKMAIEDVGTLPFDVKQLSEVP